MTDYRIDLLNSGKHAVGSLNARCADNQEALGLAEWMLDGRRRADVWTGTRRIGRISEASDADIKAFGQPWASQPFKRA